MKRFAFALAALALVSAPAMATNAPPKPKTVQCKDAKGKFIKCPPKVAPKVATTGKKAPCRDAKGRFTKCK